MKKVSFIEKLDYVLFGWILSRKPITIGNNVWIGTNSVILSEVEIVDDDIIGAGSIVTINIPSNSIAVGNPCKVIKNKEKYLEDLSKIIFNKKISLKFQDFIR